MPRSYRFSHFELEVEHRRLLALGGALRNSAPVRAAAFVALGNNDLRSAREHFRRFRSLALGSGADDGMVVVSHNLADLALTLLSTCPTARRWTGCGTPVAIGRPAWPSRFAATQWL